MGARDGDNCARVAVKLDVNGRLCARNEAAGVRVDRVDFDPVIAGLQFAGRSDLASRAHLGSRSDHNRLLRLPYLPTIRQLHFQPISVATSPVGYSIRGTTAHSSSSSSPLDCNARVRRATRRGSALWHLAREAGEGESAGLPQQAGEDTAHTMGCQREAKGAVSLARQVQRYLELRADHLAHHIGRSGTSCDAGTSRWASFPLVRA